MPNPYQDALRDRRPQWWTDPRPGDRVVTLGDRRRVVGHREVVSRPEGAVEYKDHRGHVATVQLESWRAWADRNQAEIDFYGT